MIIRRLASRCASRQRSISCIRTVSRSFTTSLPSSVESEQQRDPEALVEADVAHNVIPSVNQAQQTSDPAILSYMARQHMNKARSQGTSVAPTYDPERFLEHPPTPKDISLELLMASESHFGASTSLWNPANSRYIFGVRSGIHIIALEATAQHLRRAARVVSAVAARAGLILFVGTRPGFDRCVIKAAKLAAPACHLFNRWTPGTITNSQQIIYKNALKIVDDLDDQVEGLDQAISDHKPLMPDLVVCFNPTDNYTLLHECALNRIPTIGVIDTDADPTWVTYPIPANDDSLRCIALIAGVLGHAGGEGQQTRIAAAKQGKATFNDDDPSFSLPRSFSLDEYLKHREQKNPGQLRRDIEAKLAPSEVASLASGKSVRSLQRITQRLRRDEIMHLRQYYESTKPPESTLPANAAAAAPAMSMASAEAEAEQNENTLSELSKLAAEAAHRVNSDEEPAKFIQSLDDYDADGDPWEKPSVVVINNRDNLLAPDELKLLEAKDINYADLAKLQPKIPPNLYSALFSELSAEGRVAYRVNEK